jgi:hypothetical protein
MKRKGFGRKILEVILRRYSSNFLEGKKKTTKVSHP